jgi:ABC-type phosphate transport system substrate-binding protein
MSRSLRPVLVAAMAMAAVLCATAPPAGASAAAVAGHRDATEVDNGTTVGLHRGDTLTVTLHSTYWTIDGSSDPAVLVARGPQATQAEPPSSRRCVPGQGCGTVSRSFTAAAGGTADVGASRTSCGEALRCTPEQSTWVLHVVVTG